MKMFKRFAAALLAGVMVLAMLTACGDNDGDVSSNASSEGKVSPAADKDEMTDTSKAATSKKSESSSSSSRSESGDTLMSKADRVGDDVADGIDDGLDAAESIVDDILR